MNSKLVEAKYAITTKRSIFGDTSTNFMMLVNTDENGTIEEVYEKSLPMLNSAMSHNRRIFDSLPKDSQDTCADEYRKLLEINNNVYIDTIKSYVNKCIQLKHEDTLDYITKDLSKRRCYIIYD